MSIVNERDEIIKLTYDAAVDASIWPQVADHLADLCDASSVHLLCQDSKTLEVTNITRRYDPDVVRRYAEYWVYHNPLNEAVGRMPAGSTFSFDTVMPNSEIKYSAIYNEFFLPAGMAETLASRLLAENFQDAAVGLYRPASKGPFDKQHEQALASLIPHLQRALRLHLRLADVGMRREASADLLDRLNQAALLVDAAAHVLFANRAAEELFAERVGLHRAADGTLHNGSQAETNRLHGLIAAAATSGSHGTTVSSDRIRLPRGDNRAPLTVLVIPLRATTDWLIPRRPTAILFVSDPERVNIPTAERLRQNFGLTRAEAAVAVEILNGHGLKSAAAALGVGLVTVRTHLTAVFDKTGTHRQAELVRVLLQHESTISNM